MKIDRLLNSMPRKTYPEPHSATDSSATPFYREIINHPSLLVRVMGGIDSGFVSSLYDGLDIFVDLYLKQKPKFEDMDLGSHYNLLDALDRWRDAEEWEDDTSVSY
jgi:hypothetical protein